MSFRYKIAGALVTVLCLAITSLGLVSFSQQKRVLRVEMEKRAEALVRQLSGTAKTGILTKDELPLTSTIREIQKTPGLAYVIVHNSKGKVFAHSEIKKKGMILAEPVDTAALNTKDLLFQEATYKGEPVVEAAIPLITKFGKKKLRVGTARIGLSQKALIDAIAAQKKSYIGITITFVLLGLGISLALGNLLSRQIVILATAMKVVAQGDLDHMVKVESNDDIGRLTRSFNEMILKLREKFHMEKYLSSSTLQLIRRFRDKDQMKLGGERRRVTALFSDIRGFTSLSEKLDPQDIVGLLNVYLNLQSEVIYAREGTVDKFVGDEIMAIFTGDAAEHNAACAAIEIQNYVESLNRIRGTSDRQQIHVGIGLNSGEVIMGNMGSERQMDFTVIGDPVNIAARLCSAAGPGQVIMSEQVFEVLGKNATSKPMPPLQAKGKKKPLMVFSLLGMDNAVRRHRRKPANLPATYTLAGLSDEKHAAVIKDIGEGGCVLETEQPCALGSQVHITISDPAFKKISDIPTVVRHLRHVKKRYLTGLVFEDLDDEARYEISNWVHKVSAQPAAAQPTPNA